LVTDTSQYLETDRCELSSKYSSALDVLRRVKLSDIRVATALDLATPADELLLGMWSYGNIMAFLSPLWKMAQEVSEQPGFKDGLIKYSPRIAEIIT